MSDHVRRRCGSCGRLFAPSSERDLDCYSCWTRQQKRPSARRKYEAPEVKQTISFDELKREFEKAQAEE